MTKELASLPKYDAYKDSGVKDFGALPLHWEVLKFKNIFKFQKGLNITKENLQDEGIPCVNYGEIHSKYGFEVDPVVHPLRCVAQEYLQSSAQSLLKFGDFIFADTSEDIEGSGNFTHLNSCEPTFAGYHTIIAKATKKINFRYMAYVFDSLSYRMQIRTNVKGVKVYSITNGILKNTSVWFPSEDEQNNLVYFLDDKSNLVDRAIATKQRQIELLKERKQILIQNAVTRGLNPEVPMRDSEADWLGDIPEHWEVRRSKFVFTQRKEFARKDDVQLSATQSYGVIPQDEYEAKVGRKVVKILFNLEKRKHVEIDDFVISMRSFQGGLERAWASGCIRSSYVILKPSLKVSPGYYGYLFKCRRYIKALQATGNFIRDGQDLNFENFSMVDLPIPPLGEQDKIALYLDVELKKSDKAAQLLEQQIEKLKEYKATLIDSAVTGKIKVPQLAGREVAA